jgi:TolB-like protein
MPKNNFFEELKRRNVYRVAITYGVSAWLLIQVASILFPTFEAPTWVMKVLTIVLIIGFPIALILAWAFEMSPQGMIRTKSIEADENPYSPEGKKPFTSNAIIGFLAILVIGQFAYNRYNHSVGIIEPTPTQVLQPEIPKAPINDRSIAVLPFVNLSSDPEQEALCDGLTEEIILHLNRIKSFTKVISRSSVMSLKNSDKTLPEKAELLKVRTVLESSFQQSGNQIKIITRLIDAVNDNQLWFEIYERPFGEIFEIQSDIAKNIAAKFQAEITDEEEIRLDKKPTESSEAYILLKKGYYKMRFDISPDFQGAIDLFKKAIEIDPGLADAYVALAKVYLEADRSFRGDKSIPVEDPLPLVQEALRLDPELAVGYIMLGEIKANKEWDFPEAEAAKKKAVELDPQNAAANLDYGYLLAHMGRASEALPYAVKAVELDPTWPYALSSLAKFYFFAGNKEKATEVMEEYESFFQNVIGGGIGRNYLYLNMLEKAIENLEKVKENQILSGFLAIAYTKNGQNQKAQPLVDRLKLISQKKAATSPEYTVGLYYSGTGQKEEALYWLERSYNSHDSELYWLKIEPMFKTLHGDPRYEELLRKIGFPE